MLPKLNDDAIKRAYAVACRLADEYQAAALVLSGLGHPMREYAGVLAYVALERDCDQWERDHALERVEPRKK
jgi:hypothetical protein